MRLSSQQVEQIIKLIFSHLDSTKVIELRLFGSRVNDEALGGDVDLYLEIAQDNSAECLAIKNKLRPLIEETLDLPVDLVVQGTHLPLKAISHAAKASGVVLWGDHLG